MLDDVRGDDRPQAAGFLPAQKLEKIACFDIEALVPTRAGRIRVGVHPKALDALGLEQLEELAAPAAEIRNRSQSPQIFRYCDWLLATYSSEPRNRS